jgi:tripartite-type tricarboxylate transporter receptor subunit TctC
LPFLILSSALLGAPTDLHAQPNFYQGKNIRLIIGSSPGGGYDLWPRAIARYLTKNIPRNPESVPQNMPGAGGLVGAKYQ